MKQSVLVGLSGGIDSTITAFLLKERGYKVTGVHLRLHKGNNAVPRDRLDLVTGKLGIDWIEYDATDLFQQEVIGYFTRLHLEGRTPSPCAHCNPFVKWKVMKDIADSMNIDRIATGHYIRIIQENNLYRIYRGIDRPKDQSYYMWQLGQDVLSRALTPLGDFTKPEVRKMANKLGLEELVKTKESAGLCFAGGRSCEELLNEYIPDLPEKVGPGMIIDKEGKEIGTHKGYIYYTIGQKKDLRLDVNEKLCVARIDAANNIIMAEPWENLYQKEFFIQDFTFAEISELESSKDIQVMIRGFGLNPAGNAKLEMINNNLIKVSLENPAWAIAPGQPAVFYSGDRLLGGGIIK